MKINQSTQDILKNFSEINTNILIKPGSELNTISTMKNILAKATINDNFDREFGIYDLNEFLGLLSIMSDPELTFNDTDVTVSDSDNESRPDKFRYADTDYIVKPEKDIEMPESEINFKIKKLGIVFYKYHVNGKEIYKDEELITFNSKTNQNGKKKYVNMKLENGEYIIDGSSYKGKVPKEYLHGKWLNHSNVEATAQISAVSGRIIKQKVTFLSKEIIKLGEKSYNTLHFNFASTDIKLTKGKKLNTDVWYDVVTLNWVKASFQKQGKWEYKLVSIN